MLMACAEGGGQADQQRGARAGDVRRREHRRQRGDRAVDQPHESRLHHLQEPRAIVGATPAREERLCVLGHS